MGDKLISSSLMLLFESLITYNWIFRLFMLAKLRRSMIKFVENNKKKKKSYHHGNGVCAWNTLKPTCWTPAIFHSHHPHLQLIIFSFFEKEKKVNRQFWRELQPAIVLIIPYLPNHLSSLSGHGNAQTRLCKIKNRLFLHWGAISISSCDSLTHGGSLTRQDVNVGKYKI